MDCWLPNENSLPKRQVTRLVRFVQSLSASSVTLSAPQRVARSSAQTLIWMDTLCIPVGRDYMRARKNAIHLMARTHYGGMRVLVLDVNLQKFSHKAHTTDKTLARVLYSSWMSRPWTLQETSLARSWRLQSKDGTLDFNDLLRPSWHKSPCAILRTLHNSWRPTWYAPPSTIFRDSNGDYKKLMQTNLLRDLAFFLADMNQVR